MKAPLLPFALLLLLTQLQLHAQSDPALVGYYSFCNCNADDNSGNNNHGVLVGSPTCTDGQRGQGFLFNQTPGSNGCGQVGGECVRLPNFGPIWANGFTVCAWVRFDNIAYYERIIDFGNASGDAGGLPIWFGREGATNNLALESWINSNGSLNRTVGRLVAPNAISNGSIEYYCATISGNTMRIYVNGELKAEKTGHPILNVPRQNNYLGRSNWCNADPDFKGFMDEVRIYNRALSAAEINSLYLQTPTFAPFQSPVSPGTPVQLGAQGGAQYQWSPAASLNNPTIANPIATPTQTTTYFCTITLPDGCIYTDSLVVEVTQASCVGQCSGQLGDNIFPDGDFGTGSSEIFPSDPGLAPGYIYAVSPPPNDGFYCLANNTTSWGSFAATSWIDIQDNGPEPNGYMMVVNASYAPGLFYEKTVSVCENTVYEFSVDVVSLLEPFLAGLIRPNLSFLINGNVVCETGDVPNDQSWHTYRFLFETAPGQTSVTLAIRNNAPGGGGNDLALDNISFRACGPEILTPALINFCSGVPVSIQATLGSSPYANPFLQWQTLVGGVWTNVPNAQSLDLTIASPAPGQTFRLLAANSFANLGSANCRVVSNPVTLSKRPDLLLNASSSPIGCAGQSNGAAAVGILNGAAPFTIAWNTGDATAAIGSLPAGTYSVTVTDANGCTGQAAAIVQSPAELSVVSDAQDVSCAGGADGAILTAVSGGTPSYTYTWSNGASVGTLNGLVGGLYELTVTDQNGCTEAIAVQISEAPPLSLALSADPVSCAGIADGAVSAVVSGGTLPYAYLWSNGGNSPGLFGLAAAVYGLTVTDGAGCTISGSRPVLSPAPLDLQAGQTPVRCHGGQDGAVSPVTVSGGTAPYSYTWSNGVSTAVNNGLAAGAYVLTVTDANGCLFVETFNIPQPAPLSAQFLTDSVTCSGGNNGTAEITATGGVLPYTYSWSQGATGPQALNLVVGAYSVTLTDAAGCTLTGAVAIGQPPLLSLALSADSVSCAGAADGALSAVVSGGTPPYAYLWSNGGNSPGLSGLAAADYGLTVTDAAGCTILGSRPVLSPAPLGLQAGRTQVRCPGGQDGAVSPVTVSGGTAPYSYAWSNGVSTAVNDGLAAGAYVLSVTDAKDCLLAETFEITQPDELIGQFATDSVTCNGDGDGAARITTLTGGTAPYTYTWSNGATGSEIANVYADLYNLTITDAAACTYIFSIAVPEPERLNLATATNNVACRGIDDGLIEVQVGGGIQPYTYLWNTGSADPLLTNLPAGDYFLTVTDAKGCSIFAFTQLTEKVTPSATLGLDTEVVLGEELELTAETNFPDGKIASYIWMSALDTLLCEDCETYRFRPVQDGCVSLQVRNTAGCLAAAEVCYKIRPFRRVYFPNVFSPNGDQLNDFFTVYTDASVAQVRYLSIFDRWGGLIFSREKFNPGQDDLGWDGTRLGDTIQNGVFVWMAELEFIDGVVKKYSGDVTLVR
jgi:gliding motility-associated-like protein